MSLSGSAPILVDDACILVGAASICGRRSAISLSGMSHLVRVGTQRCRHCSHHPATWAMIRLACSGPGRGRAAIGDGCAGVWSQREAYRRAQVRAVARGAARNARRTRCPRFLVARQWLVLESVHPCERLARFDIHGDVGLDREDAPDRPQHVPNERTVGRDSDSGCRRGGRPTYGHCGGWGSPEAERGAREPKDNECRRDHSVGVGPHALRGSMAIYRGRRSESCPTPGANLTRF